MRQGSGDEGGVGWDHVGYDHVGGTDDASVEHGDGVGQRVTQVSDIGSGGLGQVQIRGASADSSGVGTAAIVPINAKRLAARRPVTVCQPGLVGQDDVGGDALRDSQHDGQGQRSMIHWAKGRGRGQLVDAPDQIASSARDRNGPSSHRRRGVVALHCIGEQTRPAGDGIGDDQVVTGQLGLVGDGDGVGHVVTRSNGAGHIAQAGDEDIIKERIVVIVRVEPNSAGGEGRIRFVKDQFAVHKDAQPATLSTDLDVIPAVGIIRYAIAGKNCCRITDHPLQPPIAGLQVPDEAVVRGRVN